jgi:hypothetical protein
MFFFSFFLNSAFVTCSMYVSTKTRDDGDPVCGLTARLSVSVECFR